MTTSHPWTVKGPMRRPKGMYVLRPTGESGWKTRVSRLIGDGLNCRWSHQAGGYVVSPTKLVKFERLYAEGWDACPITGTLEAPKNDRIDLR